ncbi:IPT/TIG domain-containing protein [Dysgonomonas sp. Marseille-P4361]|uniref:IPT/TIG domain-containing protein n=1 Tax=Dysgonomonas sp. Marseille-P4361 TaxID=2161820 RepID=UPI000D550548|nr:IPT/TIG domain-containing protein [Dysgonomonas sp. Marseille-P4361]
MKKTPSYTEAAIKRLPYPLRKITAKNRITHLLLCIVTFTVIFVSCKNDEPISITHNPNSPIVLTSFSPDSGHIAEMILLDGENFGTDTSKIKVSFNEKKAVVLSSTGTRILALVPRLPGDTCSIKVEIGDQKGEYTNHFLYKIAASVTTIAGNGNDPGDKPVYDQGLSKSQLRPVYIGMDKEFNIFVTDNQNNLVRINEAENSITVVANGSQGFNHRCAPIANPVTNVLQMGAEDENNRDKFIFCDPNAGWIPKLYFIKEWDWNGYQSPTGTNHTHYACLYCEADGNYYTRYNNGLLVRIDPKTWNARAVGMTPSGVTYGAAMHPINKNELWLAYDSGSGEVSHSICRVDVTSETVGVDKKGLLDSFEKLSGATNGAHRDGPLSMAQFKSPRMINFDADGNLYVGDNGNHCIRMINTNTMMVETIIGIPEKSGFKDGSKDEAMFKEPHGIVIDAEGIIYVSDYGNNRVRRIAIE